MSRGRRSSAAQIESKHMSIVVVGSVAYDGVETPHGKVDRMLGGACTYICLAASYFAKTKIVAVVGDDFAAEDEKLLSDRGIDLEGLERVKGGKTFFWAGVYSQRYERSHHAADRSERVRRLQSQAAGKLQEIAVPAARQHPARPAAQRARADERSPPGRRRHHELLDQRFSRRAAEDHPRLGFSADQRQRSAACFRAKTTSGARPPRSWRWAPRRW